MHIVRRFKVLDGLSAERKEELLAASEEVKKLEDLLALLAKWGVAVSLVTLQRFVRKHREEQLAEDDGEMREGVDALAKRGRGSAYRKGTLEALRQRLYEQALVTNDPAVTQKLYAELLKEEARVKELELEERRLGLAEEQVRIQRLRLKIELKRAGRRKVGVVEVSSVASPAPVRELVAPELNDKIQTTNDQGMTKIPMTNCVG
jgi:hypothetical protein